MNVVIAEDEKFAAERIRILLGEYDASIKVLAQFNSIRDTVDYMKKKPHPDLLLLDINLADGNSFEIFKQINYNRPVIFTTAHDCYALDAFKMMSIDYILKPVTLEALATALNKYRLLADSFIPTASRDIKKDLPIQTYRKRFLGKIGQRLFFVADHAIACFHADNKMVNLVDRKGHRYLVECTMERLVEQLEPDKFFRVNRSYLVHADAIQQVKPYFNHRLRIYLEGGLPEEEVLVSREKVSEFKTWAGN